LTNPIVTNKGFEKPANAADLRRDRMRRSGSKKVRCRLTLIQLSNLHTVDMHGHSFPVAWLTAATAPTAAACFGKVIDCKDCRLWLQLWLVLGHWHHGMALLI
jgi:hypothetical protein